MKILTTPWKDDFLELVHQSKKSIKITSPFVKQDICEELINAKNNSSKVELITSFKLMSIYSGSLDISAIENIISNNGTVKNFPKLHSKIYLFDDCKAIISSGNLTYGGLMKNYEYGIYLEDKNILQKISSDFNDLSQNERTGLVKQTDLETVKEILSKIPKVVSPKFPSIEIETPEEKSDVIETSVEPIESSLKGWKLEVFKCVNAIPKQIFTLAEISTFEYHLRTIYPENQHINDKIRQQLQYIRDLGLIEFLGNGKYKKLWK
ncbi:MAG: NgoFVII family restriction endonuclease [Ignavibacteriae bacterium]|nr:NgoFVII family restriction endonuclease [Ignavibacteriota bacterium]